MCGLVGMMGDFSSADVDMIQDLAYVIGLRGQDGAGVLQGRSSKYQLRYTVKKTGWSINTLINHHKWGKDGDRTLLNSRVDNFYAVHARHATKGALNEANSHPFENKRYVGQHNGTLLDQKYQHATKTDSELMFQDMAERGVSAVLGDLDKGSAYAVVVLDKETGELVFARNDLRPLYFGTNKNRSVVYWASEREMLNLCAVRNGVQLGEIATIPSGFVYAVLPDTIKTNQWPRWRMYDVFKKDPPVTVTPIGPTPVTNQNGKKNKKGKKGNLTVVPPKGVVFTEGGITKITQEEIEMARAKSSAPAASSQSELIKLAKASRQAEEAKKTIEKGNSTFMEEFNKRHNAHTSWDDLVNKDFDAEYGSTLDDNANQFDKVDGANAFTPVVETGVVKGSSDFRFRPRELPKFKCEYCADELSLVQKWQGRVTGYDGNREIVCCQECDQLTKRMMPTSSIH